MIVQYRVARWRGGVLAGRFRHNASRGDRLEADIDFYRDSATGTAARIGGIGGTRIDVAR
jgi:hypothetical protein